MTIVFAFPGYEELANSIADGIFASKGKLTVRNFPDGESYVRIHTEIENHDVLIVCGLENPDTKIMMLIFFAATAKELGASKIGIIAPYLGYMRQDKRFLEGEAVTSNIFAKFLSQYFDLLVTVDPHLHRHKSLDEIYSIDTKAIHVADVIAKWIKTNIKRPLLIGPDEESLQWVSNIATMASAPFTILKKTRYGDKEVEVTIPEIKKYQDNTPVLVDDIISTAHTMLETIKHLDKAKSKPPVCIAIHAVFADDAYENLLKTNIAQVITCNTIPHPSNSLDISTSIINALSSSFCKKNVFFEVGAVLHQEEKSSNLGWNILQSTTIGTGGYPNNNYGLNRGLSFNPLTQQQDTSKYVERKNKQAEIYKNIDQLKRQKKIINDKKLTIAASLRRIKNDFIEVIHSMITRHYFGAQQENNKRNSQLLKNTDHKQVLYDSVKIKARYDIHPHVDALLKERNQLIKDIGHNK